mgnify:CR=1 FL=1
MTSDQVGQIFPFDVDQDQRLIIGRRLHINFSFHCRTNTHLFKQVFNHRNGGCQRILIHYLTAEQETQIESWLSQLTLDEKIKLLSGADTWSTQAILRLGIP